HEPLAASRVETKVAIREARAVGQHETWSTQTLRFGNVYTERLQARRHQAYAVFVPKGDLHLLAPYQAATRIGIALSEGEARDPAVFDPQICRDDDAALFFNPRTAPRGQILRRAAVEQLDEIGP